MALLTYLALGDSYTIGEQVPLFESFPFRLVQLLRESGSQYTAPEIIAKTGWTTDELKQQIDHTLLLPKYDLVTLLIGVNNQYRGRTAENYRNEFVSLLKQAIGFAGNRPEAVVVVSIPDWGVTPFAEGRDRQQISRHIDQFNAINREEAGRLGAKYAEITKSSREAATDPELLAADGLHPSGKDYARWAAAIAELLSVPA
ncbi:SGNH/GDSL hydrolase family protein [Flavihumibacter stibioxidans]|uniref:Lysophospholipase n=1 Tax=Flavihumibacter stibioxidans TaxID=1834163 RepID=A0ABR7M3X4_9BACT|nr:SGNH/GDSL hydrolase family protein [Flavihumibacter stibioxidans]MBC6489445.1 lysophospholipase [Flavihumibacter stibioxidans]